MATIQNINNAMEAFRRIGGSGNIRASSAGKKKNPLDMYQKAVIGSQRGALSQRAESDLKGAEKSLMTQYAQMRRGLGARQDVTRQSLMEDLARRQSIQGGPSGASDKIRRKALIEAERGFAQEEAGIGAEEAAARAGLKTQAAQLREQSAQFAQSLGLQAHIFEKEFAENIKTNFINATTALKQAGLSDPKKWEKMLATMQGLGYGDRAPGLGKVIKEFSPAPARDPFFPDRNSNSGRGRGY